MRKVFSVIVAGLLLIGFSGCATVQGPDVSKEEIETARESLEVKALQFRLDQVRRVNAIGYDLVETIEPEDIQVEGRPYLGLFVIDKDEKSQKLFGGDAELDGVYVAFVLDETPAAAAGLISGDILLKINEKRITSPKKKIKRVDDLIPGESADLTIVRNGQELVVPIDIEELPIDVRFTVFDMQAVNAAASTDEIMVTYGLINFSKSDDEIAAVIGHELGHLTRKHVNRKVGGELIKNISAIGLGIAAEAAAPGAGGVVVRGVAGIGGLFSNKFSRDLEREADYFGVKYIHEAGYDPDVAATFHERFAIEIPQTMISSYLNTHPSSPERTIRLRKAIEELKNPEREVSEVIVEE